MVFVFLGLGIDDPGVTDVLLAALLIFLGKQLGLGAVATIS